MIGSLINWSSVSLSALVERIKKLNDLSKPLFAVKFVVLTTQASVVLTVMYVIFASFQIKGYQLTLGPKIIK